MLRTYQELMSVELFRQAVSAAVFMSLKTKNKKQFVCLNFMRQFCQTVAVVTITVVTATAVDARKAPTEKRP